MEEMYRARYGRWSSERPRPLCGVPSQHLHVFISPEALQTLLFGIFKR